jgi:hypothetical protein
MEASTRGEMEASTKGEEEQTAPKCRSIDIAL